MNNKMRHEIEKPLIWQLIEKAAPPTFSPYSNLENQRFPAILYQELFRLREIKKDYLTDLAESIKSHLQVEMLTEFDAYSSGYASFVSVFFYRKEDILFDNEKGAREIEGVLIYISIEVPAYIFGKYTLYEPNCLQFLIPSTELDEILSAFWEGKMEKLSIFMEKRDFKHLKHDFLKQEPDFPCVSLFTDIPYDGFRNQFHKNRVYDLFFHWYS